MPCSINRSWPESATSLSRRSASPAASTPSPKSLRSSVAQLEQLLHAARRLMAATRERGRERPHRQLHRPEAIRRARTIPLRRLWVYGRRGQAVPPLRNADPHAETGAGRALDVLVPGVSRDRCRQDVAAAVEGSSTSDPPHARSGAASLPLLLRSDSVAAELAELEASCRRPSARRRRSC